MCSKDRNEVEALKSQLFRAGIRSEVRSNPVADALGITRLEIHIYERDFLEASRVHQEFEAMKDKQNVPNGRSGRRTNDAVETVEPEVLVEAEEVPALPAAPERSNGQARTPLPETAEPASDLAEAATLLEEEIEGLLARESQMAERCASLEEKLHGMEESVERGQAELERERSGRSAAEEKLAEACAGQASLEQQLRAVEPRLKAAEQARVTAESRLEAQTRELKNHQAKLGELKKEIASRDSQLGTLAESLAQARATVEKEKDLRQAAEQRLNEQTAARKSLEQQLAQYAELQEHLQSQHQNEQQQIRAYLGTVNKLRSRLKEKQAAS